jgi:hypothetical protein
MRSPSCWMHSISSPLAAVAIQSLRCVFDVSLKPGGTSNHRFCPL